MPLKPTKKNWEFLTQGELYRRICYLQYLAENFENDVEMIEHIVDVLSGVLQLLPASRTKVIMVKSEVGITAQPCGNF